MRRPLPGRLHNESHKATECLARDFRVRLKIARESLRLPAKPPNLYVSRSQYHLGRRFSKSPFWRLPLNATAGT
jgi:hypothetical protein